MGVHFLAMVIAAVVIYHLVNLVGDPGNLFHYVFAASVIIPFALAMSTTFKTNYTGEYDDCPPEYILTEEQIID